MLRWGLAILVVCLAASPVWGATFYVDQSHPSASDTNVGSEDRPWKTINKAATSTSVVGGDTVIVKAGIYRESVSVSRSGSAGSPITFKAKPGDRVVIDGGKLVTGFQALPQNQARGNPHYANIYYVDLNWQPTILYEDVTRLLEQAREPHISPSSGFWLVGAGSDARHLVDTVHLTQSDPNYWVGAKVFFHNYSNFTEDIVNITAYDPAAHKLTVDADIGLVADTGPEAGKDYYYIYNKLELLDQAGDWAAESRGGGVYRLYVWPSDSGAAAGHVYEAPNNAGTLVTWGNQKYLTFDGFELRYTVNLGHAMGDYTSGAPSDITVQNCVFFGNDYFSIYFYGLTRGTVRHCVFTGNGYGVMIGGGCNDILVEGNEIYKNQVDGVVAGHGNNNVRIRRNYIHHQSNKNHPDGIQLYGESDTVLDTDIWIEDNVLVCCGQSLMTAQTDGLHVNNNIFVGSCAGMLKYDWNTIFHLSQDHNTCALAGLIMFENLTGNNYFNVTNNIFYEGQAYPTFLSQADATQVFASDYNLFYDGPGVNYNLIDYRGTRYTFSNYKAITNPPLDQHSNYADPLLVNAPTYTTVGHPYLNYYFTTTRVYTWSAPTYYLVGDHVEIDFDGVARAITGKGQDAQGSWLEFAPPLDRPPPAMPMIWNWKTRTNCTLNLALQAGSWAKGRATDGSDLGSSLSMSNYRAGDFDGDGLRDIPVWPPGTTPVGGAISAWAVAAAHGAAGELVCPTAEGYVESRAAGIAKVKITFSAALNPATVNTGSLSIVGVASGNQASRIASITPQDGNTALVVQLSSALPDADRYTLTVADTVKFADGGSISGSRARQMSALAGDVDGSGKVTPADVLAVRSHAGQAVTVDTARYDVGCSGRIGGVAMLGVRLRQGNQLP